MRSHAKSHLRPAARSDRRGCRLPGKRSPRRSDWLMLGDLIDLRDKRADQAQTGSAALFGVKLCPPDVVAHDDAWELFTVDGRGDNVRGVRWFSDVRVHEVEEFFVANFAELAGSGHSGRVPPDVRHLDRAFNRANASGEQPEAARVTFLLLLEHDLHADADPEEWLAGVDDFVDRLWHA